ncbi:MAG: Gfo/Idh/MocA family oxidoreductase [Bacteroidota bacterium]
MLKKIKWGVLGVAKIAIEKVIPAMQSSNFSEVHAIASRDMQKANKAQKQLNIPKVYGSYEELLNDPDIQVVYIPLPNHLHVNWTLKALEAGKHVLCEKPIALSVGEVFKLIKLRDKTKLKVGEAFMVKTHPQWITAKELIQNGNIGKLQSINGFFSYYHDDPENIRFKYQEGGGGIWDIGCYPITTSRYIYDEEPKRVIALLEDDDQFKVDKLGSVIMDFPSGQATFTIGTQLVPYQRMQFFGIEKMLEINIPYNAPNDKACEISIDDGGLFAKNKQKFQFDICDQYTIQADLFSQAIINNTEVAVPLEDSLKNTAVIEAIFKSAKSGKWEKPPTLGMISKIDT